MCIASDYLEHITETGSIVIISGSPARKAPPRLGEGPARMSDRPLGLALKSLGGRIDSTGIKARMVAVIHAILKEVEMKKYFFRYNLLSLFCAGVLTIYSVQVRAVESDADNGWDFAVAPYLWGADIGGKTQTGTPIDVSIDELVDNLEMAFMGSFEARKNKWMILADVVYLDVATNKTVGPLNINMNLDGLVVHLAGGYNLYQEGKSRFDLIGGLRNLDLQLDLDTEILGTPVSRSKSGNTLDAIIGGKGQLALSKNWYVPYYFDIGTGDSDFTWQATAGISYRAVKWVDIALVYRHLEWDFKSDKLLDDINFSGLALGAIFRF